MPRDAARNPDVPIWRSHPEIMITRDRARRNPPADLSVRVFLKTRALNRTAAFAGTRERNNPEDCFPE